MPVTDNAIRCYICRSDKVELYKQANGFAVSKCNGCGLLWVDNADPKGIAAFYNQQYFNKKSKMGYKNYLADEKNHRKNARNILRTVNNTKDLTELRILDIGCAFGFLLDESRKLKHCDVYGVELSSYAYGYGKNKLGLNISNCEFSSANFASEFFDVVFLIGTIEHLVYPKESLNNIYRILRPDGLLVITTIDTKGMIPLYSIKPPEHIFYFNHNNLSLLLKEMNFETLVNKLYFVNYRLGDLIYRLGEFLSLSFFDHLSKFVGKAFGETSVKIPTNEIIIIAKKLTSCNGT